MRYVIRSEIRSVIRCVIRSVIRGAPGSVLMAVDGFVSEHLAHTSPGFLLANSAAAALFMSPPAARSARTEAACWKPNASRLFTCNVTYQNIRLVHCSTVKYRAGGALDGE